MMKKTLAILSLCFSGCFAAELTEQNPNPDGVRVVPMPRSVEPDEVQVTVVFPEDGQIKIEQPITIQMRLEGFPLGIDTEMPRENEIFNDPEGQSVRIVIDNQPHFSENEAFIDALDDYEAYYEEDMEFDIPFPLQPGTHIMRTFLVRSFNESLKCQKCYAVRTFAFQSSSPSYNVDLTQPYLTYNEPQGKFHYNPSMPLLLDFLIQNCQLSRDGYKIRLTIDGTDKRILTSWTPYYVYGLDKGSHTFKLELLDQENNLSPGVFSTAERTIILE